MKEAKDQVHINAIVYRLESGILNKEYLMTIKSTVKRAFCGWRVQVPSVGNHDLKRKFHLLTCDVFEIDPKYVTMIFLLELCFIIDFYMPRIRRCYIQQNMWCVIDVMCNKPLAYNLRPPGKEPAKDQATDKETEDNVKNGGKTCRHGQISNNCLL